MGTVTEKKNRRNNKYRSPSQFIRGVGLVTEKLSDKERLLLLGLASHANFETGDRAYPGNAWLAAWCHCSVRHVQRMLDRLKPLNLIEIVNHATGGRGLSVEYKIRLQDARFPAPKSKPKGRHLNVTLSDSQKDDISAQKSPERMTSRCHPKGYKGQERDSRPFGGGGGAVGSCSDFDSRKREADNRSSTSKSQPKNRGVSGFELFWSAYPKKLYHHAAQTVWNKLKPDQKTQKTILRDLSRRLTTSLHADSWKGKDPQFIPFPETYLTKQAWEVGDVLLTDEQLNTHPSDYARYLRTNEALGRGLELDNDNYLKTGEYLRLARKLEAEGRDFDDPEIKALCDKFWEKILRNTNRPAQPPAPTPEPPQPKPSYFLCRDCKQPVRDYDHNCPIDRFAQQPNVAAHSVSFSVN